MFRMLDSVSELVYNRIFHLEEELMEKVKLIRQQITVVRSVLKSVNKTLQDMSNSELIFTSELHQILLLIHVARRQLIIGMHLLLFYSH